MEYSTNGRDGTSSHPPALVPSLSHRVALVRTTVGATVGVAGRTLRACATLDPAALVAAVAAVPAIAEGVAQLVQRVAMIVERVNGVLDGVEATKARVDRVVDGIEPLSARIDGIAIAAEGTVVRIDGVVDSTGRVLDGANELVVGGRRTVAQAEETIRAADPSVRQLAEITETVSRLQPLLASLTELDPAVGKDLAAMLQNLPGLMDRVDDRVIPAVSALEGLMPVVQTLHENVDQLQSVVNDVGTLLSGLPGAGRLLKRGGREVSSTDNKTSITPPE